MDSIESPINESLNGLMGDKIKLESIVSEEGKEGQQLSSQKPVIQNISVRTLPGVLSQFNQNSIHWSTNGLIAFGSHNRVIVVDSIESLKVCQSMYLLIIDMKRLNLDVLGYLAYLNYYHDGVSYH